MRGKVPLQLPHYHSYSQFSSYFLCFFSSSFFHFWMMFLSFWVSFSGRRIPITLPNTGALARKRNSFYLRAILVICLVLFAILQLHLINSRK